MNSKLTLTIDKTIIEAAKKYAKTNGRSLSSIIEAYLKLLVDSKEIESEFDISPLVQSLWGSVKPLSASMNYKEILAEEKTKKHLK